MNKWPTKKLSEITRLVTDGKHGDCADELDSGYYFLSSKDLRNGRLQYDKPRQINREEFVETHRRTNLEPGDILLANCGASIGRVGIAQDDPRIYKTTFQKSVSVIKADKALIDNKFLYYFLVHKSSLLIRLGNGAAQPNLLIGDLKRIELPVPPPSLQRKIAAFLSAYDELIENSQRRIEVLEETARILYREFFVLYRFPGCKNVKTVTSSYGKIPEGWEITPLSSLVDFAKGRKPTETRKEALPGDVKLLLIDSLHGGVPVFASPAKLILAELRDTIMVMDGASSCEVTIGSSGAVGSTLGRFRTTRPDLFSPHELYRFLELKAEEFKSKNIGAAIPHANKDYILAQPVDLPPKDIALSFHSKLESIQSAIDTHKTQVHNLRRTRDMILPRLMSGQIELELLGETLSPREIQQDP